jgi:serine/threonine-protein kinase
MPDSLRTDLFEPGHALAQTYRIRRKLGQGGMGQVWDAYDEVLCRAVAVKVAWPDVSWSNLRQEAQFLAALRHPAIPIVYGLVSDGPIHFLIMERVEGRTLDHTIAFRQRNGEPLAIGEVIGLLIRLAEGLDVIHQAGLAHRDVKPANIIVGPAGRLVFIDFGIGVAECAPADGEFAVGTPAYMAPEVAMGLVGPGRGLLADLYALGVVAYELLTLQLPYRGRDIMQQHMAAQVPRLRAARSDVPEALDELVAGLMAKAPSDRPGSALAVIRVLQELGGPDARPRPSVLSLLDRRGGGGVSVRDRPLGATPPIGLPALSSERPGNVPATPRSGPVISPVLPPADARPPGPVHSPAPPTPPAATPRAATPPAAAAAAPAATAAGSAADDVEPPGSTGRRSTQQLVSRSSGKPPGDKDRGPDRR